MKRFTLIACSALTFAFANETLFDKVLTYHKNLFGGGVDFNVSKMANEKYKITLLPKFEPYTKFFTSKPSLIVTIDEGPFIATPNLGLGKFGFFAKENFFKFIGRKEPKNLKKSVFFTLAGKVNFSHQLQEEFKLDAISIEDNNSAFLISPLTFKSEINLNNYTGWAQIYLNSIILKGKKDNSLLSLNNIITKNEFLQSPIDGFYLFSKNHTQIKKVHLITKDKYHLNINTSFDFSSALIKKDKTFSKFDSIIALKALDTNTSYFAKGLKELTYEIKIDKLGTKGVINFIKLTQKMQKAQDNLIKASQTNDDIAIQKAILQMSQINNKLVEVFNQAIIPNKTNFVLNLILQEAKENHIKLNLLYKGEKLNGSLQSAYISLLAQNLNLFDGDFDIAINRDFAFNLYPLSTLLLDLLKTKGLAKEQNGIYQIKGKLKSGKIIINNHAYTLQELNLLLFKGL